MITDDREDVDGLLSYDRLGRPSGIFWATTSSEQGEIISLPDGMIERRYQRDQPWIDIEQPRRLQRAETDDDTDNVGWLCTLI